MSFGFHPISKAEQVRKVPVKQRKQHNKPEIYRGRRIPLASTRGKINRTEYNEALRKNGDTCFVCGTTIGLEAHHVKFRSDSGRGKWRNIRFLCFEHHKGKRGPHHNERFRRELEKLHEDLYGPWYWADKYDLYKAELIPNTTDEAFETFMQEEERKAAFLRVDAEASEAAWF